MDLGKEDGIMYEATRNAPLTEWQKEFNDQVSKERQKDEQSCWTLKRRFNASVARYMSLPKELAEIYWKAICYNILKATNMLAPQSV